MSFEEFSNQFETDAGVVYFDSSGRSVLPKTVEEIGVTALKKKSKPWNGMDFEEDAAKIRSSFGSLINASSDCVAICPTTSFAMSMAAKNIIHMGVLHAGTCVLLLEKQMASAVYPWQDACNYTSATLRIVQDPLHQTENEELTWADQIIEQIDSDVSVIVLPVVHWCDGSIIGLEKIAAFLEEIPLDHRPFLVIDGTQSIGVMPFDVQRIKPTFVCASVHKWLNCPYGMCLVYLDPSLHDLWDPLDLHERARLGSDKKDWDEVNYMDNETGYPETFMPGARRLDSGGKANPILVPMVAEALRLTALWGPARILQHITTLTDAIAEKLLSALGSHIVVLRPRAQRCGQTLGIRLHKELTEGVFNSDKNMKYDLSSLGAELKEYDIHVSIRAGVIRVSPYIHNTLAHVNKFVTVFIQLVTLRMLRFSTTVSLLIEAPLPPPPVTVQDMPQAPGAKILKRPSSFRGSINSLTNSGEFSSGFGLSGSTNSNSNNTSSNNIKGIADVDCNGDVRSVSSVDTKEPIALAAPSRGFKARTRILLTGSTGWLGQVLCQTLVSKALTDSFELFAGSNNAVPDWIVMDHRVPFDVTDEDEVRAAIEEIRPHVVIHTAAMASPFYCHKVPKLAAQTNAPECLITALKNLVPDCLFLFTSTDMVYDGEHSPYSTISTAKPLNVYGASKLQFESQVTSLKHGVVLRLSNMIGPPHTFRNVGSKFTQFLSESCEKRAFIGLRTDEVRSFVHVSDVVAVVLRSIKQHTGESGLLSPMTSLSSRRPSTLNSAPLSGNSAANICTACTRKVLNVGGPDGLSRMQLAGIVATAMGVKLKVTHAASESPAEDTWEVSAQTAAPNSGPVTDHTIAGLAAGELRSPLDISMNSVMTESHLGMKFSDLPSVIKNCLNVI